jgi:hypothetical protein
MSPRRIIRSGDLFDRSLLDAARSDGPPAGAEGRALAGLGLSVGLAVHSAGPVPSGSIARRFSGWPLKAGAVALTLGAIVTGVWIGAARRPVAASIPGASPSALEPTAPGASASSASSVAPAALQAFAAGPGATPPVVSPTERVHLSIRRAVPSGARSVTAAAGESLAASPATAVEPAPLSLEIALVQQAARATAGGEATVALDLLDTYRRECPRGLLAEEAGVLRVQALAQSGRPDEAKALARRLLDARPHGVLAQRLQAVLDGSRDASR